MSSQYEMMITFLTENQFYLIKAIALEDSVAQPQSNEFSKKYKLPGASSIKKALDGLKDKDLVYQGQNGYMIYDRFLDLWLKRTFM